MGVFMDWNWRTVDASGAAHVGWLVSGDQSIAPYDRMAAQLAEVRAAGFTANLLPPSTLGAAGAFSGGYDLVDNYAIDGTAFGSSEQLRRFVAIAHRYEMQVYGDLVLHQMDGGTADGTYTYKSVGGAGRFPKHSSCFVEGTISAGGVPVDPVPNSEGNFGFGAMCSYVNSTPPGYMHDEAIAAAGWLVRAVGLDGLRIDDAKGTNGAFVYELLTSSTIAPLWCFAEYYDGNSGALWNYVHGYEQGRCGVLDFALKFNAGTICDGGGTAWAGACANLGYCTVDPANAVTFCESADTDTSYGEQTVNGKILAYALMLTFPGYPMVYYRDWSTDPHCYGLKNGIDNLVWIHERLAQGDFVVRLDTDQHVFAHERSGFDAAPGCTCVFNTDPWSEHTITVDTKWGPHAQLHNYASCGSVDDVWTDAAGRLTLTVQACDNGYGYLIYAPPGIEGGFDSKPVETNQTFEGADDLKIGPIINGTLQVGRVWAQVGSWLSATLTITGRDGWGNSVDIATHVTDSEGFLAMMPYDDQGEATQGHTTRTKRSGWHTISIVAIGMPDGGTPFSLRATYTAAPYLETAA